MDTVITAATSICYVFAADDRQNNPLFVLFCFVFLLNALSGRRAPRDPRDPFHVYRPPVGRLELTICRLAGRVVFNEAESSRNIRAHPQTISAAWNQSLGNQAATWHAPGNRTRSTPGQNDITETASDRCSSALLQEEISPEVEIPKKTKNKTAAPCSPVASLALSLKYRRTTAII